MTETEVRGQRGAYFVHATIDLAPNMERTWHLVADVCQDSAAIVHLINRLKANRSILVDDLESDIASNNAKLEKIVASADGLQVSNHQAHCVHHFANVMFNVMRGGIFADQYRVNTVDFIEFVSIRNRTVLDENAAFFSELPAEIDISDLQALAEESGNADLIRLSYAYLPLSFSRRHGDPSRPWNRFAINIKKDDGSTEAGLRRKLARYFPELGSARLFLSRVCRKYDLYLPECHHGRWLQSLSNHPAGDWIGNFPNPITPGQILVTGATIRSFICKN